VPACFGPRAAPAQYLAGTGPRPGSRPRLKAYLPVALVYGWDRRAGELLRPPRLIGEWLVLKIRPPRASESSELELAFDSLAELSDLTSEMRQDIVHRHDALKAPAVIYDGHASHPELTHRLEYFFNGSAR
jgi:hypothetical protein